jgi:hypothetical protein
VAYIRAIVFVAAALGYLLIKCPLCNVEYIKASENLHLKAKKHILNKEAYKITHKQVKEENITSEDEHLESKGIRSHFSTPKNNGRMVKLNRLSAQ